MGSTRYPGKVMMDIEGKPMLWHLIKRLRYCRNLEHITVGTSVNYENDVIASFCADYDIPCYRGSEDDVLARLLESLEAQSAEIGVVVYGDNPLIDPRIVDEHIELFKTYKDYDWIGNDLITTFPPGMDVEVFSVNALRDAAASVDDLAIREHGTLFIRQNPRKFRLLNVEAKAERCRPDLYLGVDTHEDVDVVRQIKKHFKGNYYFSLEDLIQFLDCNPQIAASNQAVERRWRQYRND